MNQKPPLQGALIEIEKLPARFVFFGPPSGLDAELQPGLGLRLLELLRGDLPAVDGPVVGPAAAENTAPASAPAGGRVEENNKRDDGEGGDDRPKPLLMPPNMSKHKSDLEPIQARTLPAPAKCGQTQKAQIQLYKSARLM